MNLVGVSALVKPCAGTDRVGCSAFHGMVSDVKDFEVNNLNSHNNSVLGWIHFGSIIVHLAT